MSHLTKQAIVAKLEADSQFTALVATDPNAPSRPALFNSRMNEMTPVYNCVTFREAGSKPVNAFASAIPGDDVGRVEAEHFDFEVWTKDTSTTAIDEIQARLDAILNQQAFDLNNGGRVFWSERTITSPDNWDPNCLRGLGCFGTGCWWSMPSSPPCHFRA